MKNDKSITQNIKERFSCRHYKKQPIAKNLLNLVNNFIDALPPGPFRTDIRFEIIAANQEDDRALRGMGTYGFIRNAPAYIIGAGKVKDYWLEDFGYQLESIILFVTSLGLGSCWLGGTFTKSRFAKQINLEYNENIPAIAAFGEIASRNKKRRGLVSYYARASTRKPWEDLFFIRTPTGQRQPNVANLYNTPLKMLRLAPSASNKQPWQVIFSDGGYHFFLKRTPGYLDDPIKKILQLCDLQRVDMGIAMSHFELTAREMGLTGSWKVLAKPNSIQHPPGEYLVSWIP